MNILQFPKDILFEISKHMDPRDVLVINKLFNSFLENEILWEHYLQRDFKDFVYPENVDAKTFRDKYIYSNSIKYLKNIVKRVRNKTDDSIVNVRMIRVNKIPLGIKYFPNLTSLVAVGGKIKYVPEYFSQFNIKTINLMRNNLTEFPKAFYSIPSLEKIILNHNKISDIQEDIINLKNLVELDLSSNSLSSLPLNFEKLNLITLNLKYNVFKKIPSCIEKIKTLQCLYIDCNKISSCENFPSNNLKGLSIKGNKMVMENLPLTRIDNLDISMMKLEKLPESFSLLNISVLKCCYNNLREFPEQLLCIKNLDVLELSHNKIKNIPHKISELANLTCLNLSSNEIRDLPEQLFSLKKLEFLYIGFNKLSKLSENISKLSKLSVLNLKNNNLDRLPDSMSELAKLKKLCISRNKISHVPHTFSNLKKLETFKANKNNFKEIPKFLEDSSSIKFISLNKNNIEKVSKDILYKNLGILNLEDNIITHLEAKSHLVISASPRFLKLSKNKIKDESFLYSLFDTTKVDLRYNNIEKIEDYINRLPNLKYLFLDGNPIKTNKCSSHIAIKKLPLFSQKEKNNIKE